MRINHSLLATVFVTAAAFMGHALASTGMTTAVGDVNPLYIGTLGNTAITVDTNASPNVTIANKLTVNGTSTLTGAVGMSSTLNVTGQTILTGHLGIGISTPYGNGMMDVEPPSGVWAGMFNYGNGTPPSPYGIWAGGATYAGYFSGPVYASAYYHLSDARLKTDIHPIDHALDKMLALRGIEFNWKDGGRPDMGVTAQNVNATFPNVIGKSPEGMMAVEYDSMIGPIIESFRELKQKNDHLEAEIADLRKELHERDATTP